MVDLKRFKEAIASYGTLSTFVKLLLNYQATGNRIIPCDWQDLVTALLKTNP